MKKLLILVVGVFIIWMIAKNIKLIPLTSDIPEMSCYEGAGECIPTGNTLHKKERITILEYFNRKSN